MKKINQYALAGVMGTGLLLVSSAALAEQPNGKWMSGDFHQHSYYSDGSTPFDYEMKMSYEYGLDWWANSEHGGERIQDGNNIKWDDYLTSEQIFGVPKFSNGHQLMYRWQSLRDFAYPDILRTRALYPDRRIVSGVEWNVPGHEHCSVGIVADTAEAISAFEFQFDKSDTDSSRTGEETMFGTLVKKNGLIYPGGTSRKPLGSDRHGDAVAACAWIQEQKDAGTIDDAWIVFAHIERAGAFRTGGSDGGYNIEHFRDFNNAAPDICVGFEGAPGHQQNPDGRGGFGGGAFGGTYGGTGFYTAKVGGLWDALLSEGRRWFNFASSDYHLHWTAGGDDYYPGEYQKTWTHVQDIDGNGDYSLKEIAMGLRSGNSWHVMGDLISSLEFEAQDGAVKVPMGGELRSAKAIKNLKLKIKFRPTVVNHNGDTPVLDHIDLIAGNITGKIPSTDPRFTQVQSNAQVVERFTSEDWEMDEEGNYVVVVRIKSVETSTFFRLRGTNNRIGIDTLDIDENGEPVADFQNPATGNDEAWADLWFYSNPIFVYAQ